MYLFLMSLQKLWFLQFQSYCIWFEKSEWQKRQRGSMLCQFPRQRLRSVIVVFVFSASAIALAPLSPILLHMLWEKWSTKKKKVVWALYQSRLILTSVLFIFSDSAMALAPSSPISFNICVEKKVDNREKSGWVLYN